MGNNWLKILFHSDCDGDNGTLIEVALVYKTQVNLCPLFILLLFVVLVAAAAAVAVFYLFIIILVYFCVVCVWVGTG